MQITQKNLYEVSIQNLITSFFIIIVKAVYHIINITAFNFQFCINEVTQKISKVNCIPLLN